MAVKTFITGEKLTASDTNTYLNNGGLVYISSTTIGSGVSPVIVDGFSATYDAYKIIVSGGSASGTTYLNFRVGASTGPETAAVYQQSFLYTNLTNTAVAYGITTTAMTYAGSADANGMTANFEIMSPYLTGKTTISSPAYNQGGFAGYSTCLVNTNSSYTRFYIYTNAGTMTGGTITLYGYRKA